MRKNLTLILVVASMMLAACAQDAKSKKYDNRNDQEKMQQSAISKLSLGLKPYEIRLEVYNGENYLKSTYNLMFENQGNEDLTLNNWSINLNGYEGSDRKNSLDVRVFENTGESVSIVDLGERSCADIQLRTVPESLKKDRIPVGAFRRSNPAEWFKNSEVMDALDKGNNEFIDVLQGHCYAYYSIERQGRVGAVFFVKESVPGKYAIINSIEVFERVYKYNYLKY